MKVLILACALLLAGCSTTVPVTVKFPQVPPELLETCPESLQALPSNPQLSQLVRTVAENYTEYHVCRERVQAWIEWYSTQSEIYGRFK